MTCAASGSACRRCEPRGRAPGAAGVLLRRSDAAGHRIGEGCSQAGRDCACHAPRRHARFVEFRANAVILEALAVLRPSPYFLATAVRTREEMVRHAQIGTTTRHRRNIDGGIDAAVTFGQCLAANGFAGLQLYNHTTFTNKSCRNSVSISIPS